MPISLKQPLALADIAELWSRELRDTRYEEPVEKLLEDLVFAITTRDLAPFDPDVNLVVEDLEKYTQAMAANVEPLHKKPKGWYEAILSMLPIATKVSHDEFVRWVKEKEFIPRPTFWDGEPIPPNESDSISVAALSPREKCNAWIKEQLKVGITPPETIDWKTFARDLKNACGDVKGFSDRNLRRKVKEFQQELRTKAIR
jgi:hypothetical protein